MLNLEKCKTTWVSLGDINHENTQFRFRNRMSVDQLAQSMKDDGQKLPVLLWRRERDWELQLISGFRRFTAAKSLDWEKILAVVIPEEELPEDEALRLNFIENIERKSLNDLDMMFACDKLSKNGKSNREIAKLIGRAESSVRRYLKVVNAPEEVQDAVRDGKIGIDKVSRLLADAKVRRDGAPSVEEMLKDAIKSINYAHKIDEVMADFNGRSSEIGDIQSLRKAIRKAKDKIGEVQSLADLKPTKNMFVKNVKGGFDLVLKFRSKSDSIENSIEFMERNIKKMRQLRK